MTESDDSLPGEVPPDVQDAALEAWALRLIAASLPDMSDHMLSTVLTMHHEEWERRFSEMWVLAE